MTNPAEKIVTFKMKYQNKKPKRMEQKKRQISLSFVQDNYFDTKNFDNRKEIVISMNFNRKFTEELN